MYKYLLLLIFVSQNCLSENISEYCTDEMIHQYSNAIRKEIYSKVSYPRVALGRGLEGYVIFNITLVDSVITNKKIIEAEWHSSDIVVTDNGIIQSTAYRYPVFDRMLLSTINIEDLPQLTCKTKLKEENVSSRIEFRLSPPLYPETSSLTHPSSETR